MPCTNQPKTPSQYRKWRNSIADNTNHSLDIDEVIYKAYKKAGIIK